MKKSLTTLVCTAAVAFGATNAVAQNAAQPSAPPSASAGAGKVKTRQLAAPMATSTEVLGSLAAVRQLPNGNVLVNDQARHRVLLMDKSLNVVSVVADSTSNTGNAYGVRPGGLLAFRGDSTLFVDPASLSMLVIDPFGVIARTMAAPRANDVGFLIGGNLGNPGFDSKGRLIYRAPPSFPRMTAPQPGQPFVMPTPPDSAALVRYDLGTRKLDTAAFFKLAKTNVSQSTDANGGMRISVVTNPLPVVDDWAVLIDGTIAIVRGQDYHVDFIDVSGAIRKSDKIPYDWQRMTDDDKQNFIDSARVAMEKLRAANTPGGATASDKAATALGDAATTTMSKQATSSTAPAGAPGTQTNVRIADGGGGQRIEFGGPVPAAGGASSAMLMPINLVSPSELPDYKPVFGMGSVRSDMDGRLWVRTIATKVTTGGAIYEVIDMNGKLVDRIQVPVGTTIAGFGAGGIVYLGFRDAAGVHVQRAVVSQ